MIIVDMISLFSGAGGLDWAFHNNDDYNLVISNEILENHIKTYADNNSLNLLKIEDYKENQNNIAVCGDIHELNINQKADVIMGGPPCQDFSVLRGDDNRNGFTVQRGQLYRQYLRIMKSTNPDIFVFENVVGMVSANKGAAYEVIQNDFIEAGYDLVFNEILDMSNLGVPQARKRLIIIGLKKELNIAKDDVNYIVNNYLHNKVLEKYPLVPLEVFEGETLPNLGEQYTNIMKKYSNCMDGIDNHESDKWRKEYESLSLNILRDYISINEIKDFDMDEFDEAMVEHENILKLLGYYHVNVSKKHYADGSNTLSRRNSKIIERMHHIPPNYNFKAVTNTQWEIKGLMSNIYKRIHPLKPSPTVIAYGGGGTGGYHYEYDRQGLTNRERARLQTFPDDYIFKGKTSEIRAQIGEAVPPLASYHIEKTVTGILKLKDTHNS